MTETLPPPETKPARRCWKRKLVCFFFILALIVAIAIGLNFCPWFIRMQGGREDVVQLEQRIMTLESQVRELDHEVGDLNNHGPAAQTPADTNATSAAVPPATAPAADIAHTQNDIAALSSALAALEAEVKQTGSHAAATQQATQASLAAAIAFIQLRATADAGQSFANELSAMRDATKSDLTFQEGLGKLDAMASKGAPTATALGEDLLNLEPDATLAIDKANATGWWQRLLTELRTLVSIRKQHSGSESDAFTAMESDLAKGDVARALGDMQGLPPDAQTVLADWRAKAEARQTLDTVLRDMAAHFTALASPAPAPSTQGEP